MTESIFGAAMTGANYMRQRGFHKAAESTDMLSNLANLMAHNVSTAQKYV